MQRRSKRPAEVPRTVKSSVLNPHIDLGFIGLGWAVRLIRPGPRRTI